MAPLKKNIPKIDLEDSKLLEQWNKGDKEAFRKLYKKYYGIAVAFCISLSRNKEISEDITQVTFTRIWKRANKGKNIENFKKYLFRALTLNYLEHLRKVKKEEARIIPINDSVEDRAIAKFMDEDTLEEILTVLNEEQKKVFKSQMNGHKIEEIANDNGMSKAQVRGLLYRAREKLKKNRDAILDLLF